MGKTTGFKEYAREVWAERPVGERLKDYREFHLDFPQESLAVQGARCMDCGIPYCHSHGCPLGNLIPDWNDMVYRGRMREAIELLHYTNNFPEFTGRICPAPCEKACTLSINDDPVSIKLIELEIIEHAFSRGWIIPQPPLHESGRRVAVVGAGPAGLSAAQQLRRAGHTVHVYERDEAPGGLLRFGIPDFKLEKRIIERRIRQLEAEGVVFELAVNVGEDISVAYLKKHFDAILLTVGAKRPRDLAVPGRDLPGVHFAMDFLSQNNRRVAGVAIPPGELIDANGKNVIVIGGGDTGSDCVGTSNRQGAKSVRQFEVLPKPVEHGAAWNPAWPDWPNILRTSSSHEEGCERRWSVSTIEFLGKGSLQKLVAEEVEWNSTPGAPPRMQSRPGTRFEIEADLVLLAMGFLHPEPGRLLDELAVELDGRGNVKADRFGATSVPGIFAAGDAALGASLVVRAQATGRSAAIGIDRLLSGGDSLIPDTALL
jgi:glutamate synthase (NADPH/NADH) small chain